jgi:predicted Ser/Thr protein kinase
MVAKTRIDAGETRFHTDSVDAALLIKRKYKSLQKCLGKGAFGAVFLYSVRDRPEQKVAIKIICKDNFKEL